MVQSHVIGALSNKRAELAGILRQLEQQLAQQRTNRIPPPKAAWV